MKSLTETNKLEGKGDKVEMNFEEIHFVVLNKRHSESMNGLFFLRR